MPPTQLPLPPVTQPPGSRAAAVANSQTVQNAILQAAVRTEVDFDYLLAQARLESGLDPSAQANTSSATGLYQFIDRTWLGTIQRYGAEHGYGWAANAIETVNGRPTVRDPGMRAQILHLRNDPQAASLMAGEFAAENARHLEQQFGRSPDETELYLAHFLGPNGAARFIVAHQQDPSRSAADLFANAAAANRAIFYDQGRPRSLAEVRNAFALKLDRAKGAGGGPAFNSYTARGPLGSGPSLWSGQQPLAPMPSKPIPSMAQVLRATFGDGRGLSPAASDQIARAHDQFARFGL